MATSAQGGFGVVFKVAVSAVLTVVTNVKEVKFPAQEKAMADVTGHDSTGGYAEYIPSGRRELGEFSVTLFWDKSATTHAAIKTAFDAETSINCSVQDPDGDEVIAFAAHVTKIERMGEQEDAYQAEITFQPTGIPTITP